MLLSENVIILLLIWGTKNLDRTFALTFQDESQLPTFQVANCDGENSRTGYHQPRSPRLPVGVDMSKDWNLRELGKPKLNWG